MQTKGLRDVGETVATAALCTVVVGLANLGIDLLRRKLRLDDENENNTKGKQNES